MTPAKHLSRIKCFAGLGLTLVHIGYAGSAFSQENARRETAARRPATNSQSSPIRSAATLSPEWFENHLAEPSLRSLVSARFAAHHCLTRADMIAIFHAASEGGTINPEQFQTLQAVAENARILGMGANVADLARKVVLGDLANAHFQQEELGNLEVGSSAARLNRLVRKWFLGEDPPAIDATLHYQKAAGVLFDGLPKLFDLHQGDLGDCYFVATLGEVALRNPEQIERMFIDNHDGTFTVRFFHDGKPTYVTVDRYLPVDEKGRFVYENRGDFANNATNILWLALAEKALAQLNESGWLKTAGTSGVNSLAAIGSGGKGKMALPLVTGLAGSRDGLASLGAFAKGELELANSKPEGIPAYLLPHHSYVVVDYDPARAEVTLFNPWGLRGNKKDVKYGKFSMSWQDFAADFLNIDHAAVKGPIAVAATPKNGMPTTAAAPKITRNRTLVGQTVE